MKKFLSLILLFFCTLFYSQLSTKVSKLYKQIEEIENEKLQIIGHGEDYPKLKKIYDSIRKIASKKEIEYLAFYGTPNAKYHFSKVLIYSKSKKILELYSHYIYNIGSVTIRGGSHILGHDLANDLYQEIYNIPRFNQEVMVYKEMLKSNDVKNDKKMISRLKKLIKEGSAYTEKEAKDLILKFDKLVLDNKNSPKRIVEYICLINQFSGNKLAYFDKFYFFKEKYNSEIIAEYIKFCDGTLENDSIDI